MFYRFRRRLQYLLPKINIEIMYYHDLKNLINQESKIKTDIYELDKSNIHLINQVKKMNMNKINSRLNRGDMCVVAETSNKIVSYHWVQLRGDHYIQQSNEYISIKPNTCFIYHVRVADKYKGNRINGAVYYYILNKLKNNNFNTVRVYTNKFNAANRAGLDKMGFKKEYCIISLKIQDKYFKLFQYA